ncbi:MAG: aminodeoxychorismate/anthranilate synthase component II [Halieaceae bacterium]|jgi:anthranilate synthase component 2|nr:aminodeoxychorismate/anthranilate synthase component II [Halieaceae bacterium]
MLLMIDNYDSFTWNVVQYFWELGAEVEVRRNDEIDLAAIEEMSPDLICISPGPCSPTEAGISTAVIEHFAGRIPLFGICLGMQSIGAVFGGDVVRAPQVMHGKTSPIHHRGEGVFTGLESPFTATRYHSLVVDPQTLPASLEVTAWTEDEAGNVEAIMGLRHRELAVEGVQFHPESILSQHGHDLLRNFLQQSTA